MKINKLIDKYIENDVDVMKVHIDVLYEYAKEYNALEKENKKLKEIIENLTTMTVCGDRKQIKNTAQYKLELAEQKIDKAIEYIKDNIYKNGNEECYSFDGDIFEVLEILGDKENE